MTQAEEIKTSLVIVFERKDKVTANGDAVVARRRYNGYVRIFQQTSSLRSGNRSVAYSTDATR